MFKVDQLNYADVIVKCSNLNIILGPNNSGKTIFLNNLYRSISHRIMSSEDVNLRSVSLKSDESPILIDELIPSLSSENEFFNLDQVSTKLFTDGDKNTFGWNDNIRLLLLKARNEKFEHKISYDFSDKNNDDQELWNFYTQQLTAFETCQHRLNGKFSSTINDALETVSGDAILYLYQNRDVFKEVQKNIKDVFGIDIDFDNIPQGLKSIRILTGPINQKNNDPITLAQEWRGNSILIDYEGDGIRSYLKLIITILIPSNHLIFIDEPESFLHPPQRRALGSFINKVSKTLNKQFFITSHDPEFLRNVIGQNENRANLMRFSYKKGTKYVNMFDSRFFRNMVRSSHSNLLTERILNSFSFQKTIFCEDESDRLFYEEACAFYFWDNFQNVNFVGLNGKDQALSLMSKMHEISVNASIIVDIDFVLDSPFPKLINNPELKKLYGSVKGALTTLMKKGIISRNGFKKDVAKELKNHKEILTTLNQLLDQMNKYNFHIVPIGSLESWTNSSKGQLSHSIKSIHQKEHRKLKKIP